MQSEPTDAKQSLLTELECPVCLEYIRPPIRLCENGHKICNICRQKVNRCPSCRQEFLDIRNLALEDLARQVKYPCKYRSYGCTELFNHDTVGKHQKICLHIPQNCPVAKLAFGKCSWTGSYSDIKGHLKENHAEVCCEYVEGDFKFLYSLTKHMEIFCFIFAYNEIFFSLFQVKHDIFYAVVLYVGPVGNAAKYKYKVEFVDEDDTEGVTIMHLTRFCYEDLDDVYNSGNCGKLHYDVVSRLKDKEGNVKFKLEIIRVGN
jgi:E3 ubiquitin-protein ligase SIAH1